MRELYPLAALIALFMQPIRFRTGLHSISISERPVTMSEITTPNLPAEVARYVLRYEPLTGLLFWRVYVGGSSKPGEIAGCKTTHSKGYVVVSFFGMRLLAHRLIWLIVTGEWAPHDIDHHDLDKTNNRWDNLRKADKSQNRANVRKYANNTTGYKGVRFNRRRGKYIASITFRKKTTHLGCFDTAEAAATAYEVAVHKIHGSFARVA